MAITSSTSVSDSAILSASNRRSRRWIAFALGAVQGIFWLPVISPFIGHQEMQAPHSFIDLLPGALLPAFLIALPPVLSVWFDRRLARPFTARLVTTLVCLGAIAGAALYAWTTEPADLRSFADVGWFTVLGFIPTRPFWLFAQGLIGRLSLLLPAAVAFAVGGLGGYPNKWAGQAIWKGMLAWLGFGVTFLTVSIYWDMTQIVYFLRIPTIIFVYTSVWLVGFLMALIGGLVGGALRAWVGRSASAGG